MSRRPELDDQALTTKDLIGVPIILGCAAMLGRYSKRESLYALDHAVSLGIRRFDTAQSYGYGLGEAWLGRYLSQKVRDAEVITKYGIAPAVGLRANLIRGFRSGIPGVLAWQWHRKFRDVEPWSKRSILNAIDQSRRNLHKDQIWAFLLHSPPIEITADDQWKEALYEAKQRQWVLHAGVCCGGQQAGLFNAPGLDHQFDQNLLLPKANKTVGQRWLNHVYGGRSGFEMIRAKLLSMLQRRSDDWYEELERDSILFNECLLRTTLAYGQGDALVLAMFKLEHQQANFDALRAPRLPGKLIQSLNCQLAEPIGNTW